MKEARSLRQEFAAKKGLTQKRVNGLIQDLFNECIAQIAFVDFKDEFYRASCTVNLDDYAKAYADMSANFRIKEPEAICVDSVITVALRALTENLDLPFGKEGKIELFFDKGEQFMHMVDRVWRSKPKGKLKGPLQMVSSIKTADMHDVIGLQAADILAWQTNRCYTHGFNEATGALAKIIWFAAPTYHRYCDYDHLKEILTKYVPDKTEVS